MVHLTVRVLVVTCGFILTNGQVSKQKTGNPCSSDAECDFTSKCITNVCSNPCLVSNCGPNSQCTVVNHRPKCSCGPGSVSVDGECQPPRSNVGCSSDQDCGEALACIQQSCQDPCSGGACGPNSNCQVFNHVPMCSCMEGFYYTGTGCQPGHSPLLCVSDEDCGEGLACINQGCKDPCSGGACGPNSNCQVFNHVPMCSCMEGFHYTGKGCQPGYSPLLCVSDDDCGEGLACINQGCKDPCSGGPCGVNSICQVYNHVPSCSCMEGTRYTVVGCQPELPFGYCNQIMTCPFGQDCIMGICVKMCQCPCAEEIVPQCLGNSDCPITQACRDSRCVNPCDGACGTNTECRVVDHIAGCSCKKGYTGNPFVACNKGSST